jgi:hypothetical protein
MLSLNTRGGVRRPTQREWVAVLKRTLNSLTAMRVNLSTARVHLRTLNPLAARHVELSTPDPGVALTA